MSATVFRNLSPAERAAFGRLWAPKLGPVITLGGIEWCRCADRDWVRWGALDTMMAAARSVDADAAFLAHLAERTDDSPSGVVEDAWLERWESAPIQTAKVAEAVVSIMQGVTTYRGVPRVPAALAAELERAKTAQLLRMFDALVLEIAARGGTAKDTLAARIETALKEEEP